MKNRVYDNKRRGGLRRAAIARRELANKRVGKLGKSDMQSARK